MKLFRDGSAVGCYIAGNIIWVEGSSSIERCHRIMETLLIRMWDSAKVKSCPRCQCGLYRHDFLSNVLLMSEEIRGDLSTDIPRLRFLDLRHLIPQALVER